MAHAQVPRADAVRGRRSAGAKAQRNSPVERDEGSESAKARADTKLTTDALSVRSFGTLPDDLLGMALNQLRLPSVVAAPNSTRERPFQLPGVMPNQNLPTKALA